jgi:drug/metabolite transporter (DMT)-like permease
LRPAAVALLTVAALLAGAGQLLFKIGAQGRERLIEFLNLPILAGVALYGAGTVIWVYMLSSEKLVNVYAFTALTFVLVYAGGVLLIGERISAAGLLGVVLILTGLYLLVGRNA